jgi:hypothetical protein
MISLITDPNQYQPKMHKVVSEYRTEETTYKDFILERELEFQLWTVTGKMDGTRVPTVLRGKWTSLELAKSQIDTYLESKLQRSKPVIKKEELDNDHGN